MSKHCFARTRARTLLPVIRRLGNLLSCLVGGLGRFSESGDSRRGRALADIGEHSGVSLLPNNLTTNWWRSIRESFTQGGTRLMKPPCF